MSHPSIGMDKWALDTPALLLDLDKLDRNIGRIVARCRECGIEWRPHVKASKTPAIAHKLIGAGAIGITCAKLGEAEVMAAAGIRDILVANQIVGDVKIARLVNLRRHANVMLAVDHALHVRTISEAAQAVGVNVRVLVEVDVGLHRSGVEPGKPALELAKRADAEPGVIFSGLMGYEGHAMMLPREEKETACEDSMRLLAETRSLVEGSGLEVHIVSAGGTGTLAFTPAHPVVTEVQAGGGIMMDALYSDGMQVVGFEHALTVLATVVSRPAPDRGIIDAGRKTMGDKHYAPVVTGREGISIAWLSAEHGTLTLEGHGTSLEIGDKTEIIPGYSDMTVFLHERIHGVRNDRVEVVWDVLGRGKLQ